MKERTLFKCPFSFVNTGIHKYRNTYNSIEHFREVFVLDDRKNDTKYQGLKTEKNHVLRLENRERMDLTGVLNVESFNEAEIVLETVQGVIDIKGKSMHISRLNLETGDLIIDGQFESFVYTEKQDVKAKGAGFLGKLFK